MTGFLLVGGQGRRLGGQKASRLFQGRPLYQRGWELLGQLCSRSIWLGQCPDLPAPPGVECWQEEPPGQGPLGALVWALSRSQSEWNLVLALDYPRLTIEVLPQPQLGRLAVLPQVGARRHPLCGWYHRSIARELEKAWNRGERSLLRALDGCESVTWVESAPVSAFLNVNQPEDFLA